MEMTGDKTPQAALGMRLNTIALALVTKSLLETLGILNFENFLVLLFVFTY